MVITTRFGDGGSTKLTCDIVRKNSPLIISLGYLDIFNSSLGLSRAHCRDLKISKCLLLIQAELFKMGSELAQASNSNIIDRKSVRIIESFIKENEDNSYYAGFHIPGSTKLSAFFDVARANCRQLESKLWNLQDKKQYKNKHTMVFLNRLSDLLWLYARKFGYPHDILEEYRKKVKKDGRQ